MVFYGSLPNNLTSIMKYLFLSSLLVALLDLGICAVEMYRAVYKIVFLIEKQVTVNSVFFLTIILKVVYECFIFHLSLFIFQIHARYI